MKYLFVFAHLDDETILSYGTIHKLHDSGHDVRVVICCGLGRTTNEVTSRLNAFRRALGNDILSKSLVLNSYDLHLDINIVKRMLNDELRLYKPDVIITHSYKDMHFEHRMIANEVVLAARSVNDIHVKEIWMTLSSAYALSRGMYGVFQPNVFVDISKYMACKKKALKRYKDEIPAGNDCRTSSSIIAWNRCHGSSINVDYAEPYEQIVRAI